MAHEIPLTDLGSFVQWLESRGELIRIEEPVDPHLEITEIADRFVKDGENPALLFENPRRGVLSHDAGLSADATTVDGDPVPLVINLFASKQRMAWALGCESIEEAVERIEEPLRTDAPESIWDKVRLLGKLKKWSAATPRKVGKGACQDVVVRGPDLDRKGLLDLMPVLTTWPGDAGPYITLPLVITRSPGSSRRNIGMYRMQVFDGRSTGMHWQVHKTGAAHHAEYEARGERMPVAVALGGPPALTYAATAPLPPDIDEALFAGFLIGQPVRFVKALTCDLMVPAEADFVIEGYVEAGERRTEGDFGDHTGFYSLAEDFPVFHVTAVTSRRHPIYPTTIVGRPPMEDAWLGWATERLFLPLLRAPLPEIVDIHLPVTSCFHNLVFVMIRKRYPGQARKVCQALWGMGQIMFSKVIVVVDEDVNIHDPQELLWKVSNTIDPGRDVFFVDGPVDQLDHTTNVACIGGKMGIDATRKLRGEAGYDRQWPPPVEMDPQVKEAVATRWLDLLARRRGAGHGGPQGVW